MKLLYKNDDFKYTLEYIVNGKKLFINIIVPKDKKEYVNFSLDNINNAISMSQNENDIVSLYNKIISVISNNPFDYSLITLCLGDDKLEFTNGELKEYINERPEGSIRVFKNDDGIYTSYMEITKGGYCYIYDLFGNKEYDTSLNSDDLKLFMEMSKGFVDNMNGHKHVRKRG